MTFKRFFQLFICYLLSVIVGYGVISFFPEASLWIKGLLFTVIGYIILCLPLTILTFMKSK